MVKQATSEQQKQWAAIPSSTDTTLRKISSGLLMLLLLTITFPFSPFDWLFPYNHIPLIDQMTSPVLVIGGLYFQWVIATIVSPQIITLFDDQVLFVYKHGMYWTFAAGEAAILIGVWRLESEVLRRLVSVGVLAALWVLGWKATPRGVKKAAWDQIKVIWTWMAITGLAGNTRRRRW